MSFDRRDFTASLEAKHAAKQSAILPLAQLVQGAAVLSDSLQRTPEWQRYCEYLQGYVKRLEERKLSAQQRLGDPSIVDDQQVRKLRQDIFAADVSMDTLRLAIELPAYLIKGGQEAEEFIKRMEKKNEAAEQPQSPGG